jgi:predicted RNase H-like HicB family nuclease
MDASGTYLVTVTDSNGCTSAAGSTTATVNPNPPTPTADNNGPIVEGSTLNLMASTVNNTTYSWTGPNGFASADQNPSISNATSAASGTYLVTVTDSNGCTSAAGSTTVLVTALQITSITTQGSDVLITWATTGGTTNALQATPGNPGYNTNFVDISGPLLILGSGDTTTNYVDPGAATNSPAKFYRVRLVP